MVNTSDVRVRVDSWRFWVGVAYLGIVLTIVGLYIVYVKQSREETKRVAEARATAVQQVAGCFAGVKNAPVVAGFIAGERALIVNSIDGNRAALKIHGQPAELTRIRNASLVRLSAARRNVNKLAELIAKTTPTRKACVQLAIHTHVPYQQYVGTRRNGLKQTAKGP